MFSLLKQSTVTLTGAPRTPGAPEGPAGPDSPCEKIQEEHQQHIIQQVNFKL